jgi:predicted nucleic acid-binding protein
VPVYVPEPLTEHALRRFTDDPDIVVSRLTELEFYSALARKLRMGDMQRLHTLQVANTFARHLGSGIYATLQITNGVFTIAHDFLQTFSTAIRTLDAIHLACCASLQVTLVTADTILTECAAYFDIDYELLTPDA